ncbi:MAG: hypothetical protein CMJ46_15175 [Planctomyces sp.]|nr:hypothetical protein [Planctomyces sp.]
MDDMPSFKKLAITGLTCLGLTVSATYTMAAGPSAPATQAANQVSDVALAPGGTFFGHVVDDQGKAIEGAVVKVYKGKSEVSSAVTDKTGLFAAKNVRGGVYRVTAGQANGLYRFWTAEAAPPSASTKTVLVSSPQVVRGQLGALGGISASGAALGAGGAALGGIGVINMNKTDDINDELDSLRQQLKDTQDHLDEIEDIVTF